MAAGRFAGADALFKRLFYLGLGGTTLGLLGNYALYVNPPGTRTLHFNQFFNKGVQQEEHGEGLNWLVPWFQRPIRMGVRIESFPVTTDTSTKDMQMVRVNIRVLYRPQIGHLQEIVKELGEDYAEKVFKSFGNEVLKAIVAEYDAEELVTNREEIARLLSKGLRAKTKPYHVLLDDVSITNVEFSAEFSNAIEQKQVEQQRAEQQRTQVEISRYLAMADVLKVEGESYASRIISDAMSISPDYLELKRIEAAVNIARVLSTSRNVVYLPPQTNILMTV